MIDAKMEAIKLPTFWDSAVLVVHPETCRVILVTAEGDEASFEGTVVFAGTGTHAVGTHSANWAKSLYEKLPADKEIKLMNGV